MNFVDFLCYFAFGSLFFPLMNLVTTFLVRRIDNQIDESSVSDISVKLVSAFHGILGCIIGVAIMSSCKNDIIHSRNWLTEIYAAFGLSYMVYDVFAMYVTHILDNPQIKKWQLHKRIYHYIHKNKLILLHHTGLPFIYVPVIFYFRNGKGDFFIGTFFTMEMAVPCISFRWIMLRLGRTDGLVYVINGFLMLLFFTISRILIFPFLYYVYSCSSEMTILQVVFTIPVKCNIGCLILLVLQGYWWIRMVFGFCRFAKKIINKRL